MRALVMTGFGQAATAHPGDLPVPACGPNDLLVRIAAAGVSPPDWQEMAGDLAKYYPAYADH